MNREPPTRRRSYVIEVLLLVGVLGVLGVTLFVVARPRTATDGSQAAANAPQATPPASASVPAWYPAPTPPGTPPPDPTIDPALPIHIVIQGDVAGVPPVASWASHASTIAIGTVQQVLPARWTTPDGSRPAMKQGTDGHGIFRPVLLNVESYLKGDQHQPILHLYAWGGQVGQDTAEILPDTELNDFTEGERVVVFLTPFDEPRYAAALGNQPFHSVVQHYTVTPDNQASNYYHTISLDQLLAEIRATS